MGFFSRDKHSTGSESAKGGVVTEALVKQALSNVMDPDLHQDIVTLGFVRNIEIKGDAVKVEVNLTTPACPVKETLKSQCESELKQIPGITTATVIMTASTRGGQAFVGQQVAESLGKVKNVIAVASGKGGVGKSTSAVNLAFALAKSGSKVGLLDADVYGPSVPLMTKVGKPTSSKNNMVVPPEVNGVKIISVGLFNQGDKASILRGPMAGGVVKQFLTQVAWEELDYLIIDYPPGTGDIQLTISQTVPLTGAVIVTTPQEVALIDVRKAVSMFETLKVPVLGVIETMSYFICDNCDKKHYIFRSGGGKRVADENGIPLLAEIPIDTNVPQGGDEGTPIVTLRPEAIAAKAYFEAAGATAAQLSILHEQEKGALSHFHLIWK